LESCKRGSCTRSPSPTSIQGGFTDEQVSNRIASRDRDPAVADRRSRSAPAQGVQRTTVTLVH
jgi:hypothetical protein